MDRDWEHGLVFVEGVSGVGKTTTAALLCDRLSALGCAATCRLEGDAGNPLDPFAGTYPPAMPFAAFTEAYLQCWRQFMGRRHQGTLVLDGTLLHHQINDMLRNYGAGNRAIAVHLAALLGVVQPLQPVVFYLCSRQVGRRLERAQQSRGKPAPTGAQVAFWKKRKRADLYALARLPAAVHILDVDGGWKAALEAMLAALGPAGAR